MRADNFGRQRLNDFVLRLRQFLRLIGLSTRGISGQKCDSIRRPLLDELDRPNDLSVFYCENSHYRFIIFFKPFNFPNGISGFPR